MKTAVFRQALCLLIISYIMYGCKKNLVHDALPNQYVKQVSAWIEANKAVSPNGRANIELLQKNLDYSRMREDTSGFNEKILVIPIKGEYNTALNLKAEIIANLFVLINKSGEVRTANVVFYTPKAGQSVTALPETTFYNIRNTAKNVIDGSFRFCDLATRRQYELGYQDGNLRTIGKVQPRDKGNSSFDSDNNKKAIASECTDYYLVTTYYDENGDVTGSDWQYLYSSGDCGSPGEWQVPQPDGGGGGTPEYIYALAKNKLWHVTDITETIALYKYIAFTTEDGIITKVSPGNVGFSTTLPTGTTWTQTSSTGGIGPTMTDATTTCAVDVQFPTIPFVQNFSGSKTWTYAEVH